MSPQSVRNVTKETLKGVFDGFCANQKAIAVVGKQGFISSWLTASTKNVKAPLVPTSAS